MPIDTELYSQQNHAEYDVIEIIDKNRITITFTLTSIPSQFDTWTE